MQVSVCDTLLIVRTPFLPFLPKVGSSCSDNGTCSENYALNDLSTMTKHAAYRLKDPIVLYIHGYHEDQTKDTIKMVVTSYSTRGKCNLVLIDWSHTAADLYPVVVSNVQPVC